MSSLNINFDNSFQKRPVFLHENVQPIPLKEPALVHLKFIKKNKKACQKITFI